MLHAGQHDVKFGRALKKVSREVLLAAVTRGGRLASRQKSGSSLHAAEQNAQGDPAATPACPAEARKGEGW
jgi:hypothetical protein